MTDYRLDSHGRPIHKDLDALAVEITKAAEENGGIYPDVFEIDPARYEALQSEQGKFNGGSPIGTDIGRVNFIWRGVPVCPFAGAST